MKNSIRTRFSLGMVFLFIIISVLSVFSGYYLNKLSTKTSAILKENYLSIVYAREMTEGILNTNQTITSCLLTNRNPDTVKISIELIRVNKALQEEKNNITEPGEESLVVGIEKCFSEYRDSVNKFLILPKHGANNFFVQDKSESLIQQLSLLSQMNGKALEAKTDDAKSFSKSALTQMTIMASSCFLIGISFLFSFASYFNSRISQLYYGIKEIVSSNYDQHLHFDGKDEFYEISLVFNEMTEKLKKNTQKLSLTLPADTIKESISSEMEELRKVLSRIKYLEEQAASLISRIEKSS